MANERNLEARYNREHEFIAAVVAGLHNGVVKANDLLSLCPVEMLVDGGIPRTIYTAIASLENRQEHIGIDSIWTEIQHKSLADKNCSMPAYQSINSRSLGDCLFSNYGNNPDAIFFLAKSVCNEGKKRNAEYKLYEAISECQKYGNDVVEIATKVKNVYEDMICGTGIDGCNDLSELMERTKQSALPNSATKPLPTPYANLNSVIGGGFAPGELVILAARPGMGKTALAGCIALESARGSVQSLFISREVPDITIGQRLVAREGRFSATHFRTNSGSNTYIYKQISDAANNIASLPLRIVEKSIAPMTPNEIRRIAKNTPGVGLIVVDYLQLLNPDVKHTSREREVADMSRSMKQLALDCKCPVLLLSQLNRSVTQSEREPQLSDLRESGAIEQDADIVIFLHAKKKDEKKIVMPLKTIVAKSRSSSTGDAYLIYEKEFCDFKEDNGGNWNNIPEEDEYDIYGVKNER